MPADVPLRPKRPDGRDFGPLLMCGADRRGRRGSSGRASRLLGPAGAFSGTDPCRLRAVAPKARNGGPGAARSDGGGVAALLVGVWIRGGRQYTATLEH